MQHCVEHSQRAHMPLSATCAITGHKDQAITLINYVAEETAKREHRALLSRPLGPAVPTAARNNTVLRNLHARVGQLTEVVGAMAPVVAGMARLTSARATERSPWGSAPGQLAEAKGLDAAVRQLEGGG